MPRPRKIPFLYSSCLKSCSQLVSSANFKLRPPITEEWPFDRLPAHIITDLMIVSTNTLRNNIILFTPTVMEAVIVWSPEDFKVLITRCRNLTDIILLSSPSDRSIHNHIQLLASQTQIQTIVHYTSAMLRESRMKLPLFRSFSSYYQQLIFYDMPLLRNTSLEHCKPFYPTKFYLKSLKLGVEDIKIILMKCPNVEILQHGKLVAALYSLHKSEKNLPRYKLMNLHQDVGRSDVDSVFPAFSLAVHLCPDATIVYLYSEKYAPCEDIKESLLTLNRINSLTIRNGLYSKEMMFSKAVMMDIVRKHGNSLRHLSVLPLNGSDLKEVLSFCPNLCSFDILCNCSTEISQTYPRIDEGPKNLVRLYLTTYPKLDVPHLHKLLQVKNLEVVKLNYVQMDTGLLDVLMNNYWKCLVKFDIRQCDTLNVNHVLQLLESENNLSELIIQDCRQVGAEEIRTIKNLISELGLSVLLNYL